MTDQEEEAKLQANEKLLKSRCFFLCTIDDNGNFSIIMAGNSDRKYEKLGMIMAIGSRLTSLVTQSIEE